MYSVLLWEVGDIGNDLLSWVENKGNFLANFLPLSPFRSIINRIDNIPYMDVIGWFIPIDEILFLLMSWTSAIAIYYAYMIVLRWIKAIE